MEQIVRMSKKKAQSYIKNWTRDQYSEIINGHPLSCGMAPLPMREKLEKIDNSLFYELLDKEQNYVMEWLSRLDKTKKTVYNGNSYSLKHMIGSDAYMETGKHIYMTNNQMKDALLIAGFEPIDPSELNWEYHISRVSPAFSRHRKIGNVYIGQSFRRRMRV